MALRASPSAAASEGLTTTTIVLGAAPVLAGIASGPLAQFLLAVFDSHVLLAAAAVQAILVVLAVRAACKAWFWHDRRLTAFEQYGLHALTVVYWLLSFVGFQFAMLLFTELSTAYALPAAGAAFLLFVVAMVVVMALAPPYVVGIAVVADTVHDEVRPPKGKRRQVRPTREERRRELNKLRGRAEDYSDSDTL